MKRILLIQPPIHDFYFTFPRNYPLGLLYLGTVLKKEGFKVKILNALEEKKKITLKIPPQFSYLKRYYHPNLSPFKLFDNFYHFGMEWKKIEEIIKKEKPQIIGISSNFSCYFDTTSFLANLIKKIDKRIIVVVGGHFPTYSPSLVLENENIDFVIRGEGEFSFLEFCRKIDKNIKNIEGLCYKVNNKVHISEKIVLISDLDALPSPDRTLINYKNYKFRKKIYASLITSRGCSWGCKFCAIRTPFRRRAGKNIFSEIEEAYRLGIRHFNFEDDNINLNPDLERILDFILENFIKRNKEISISFMNGVMGGLSKKVLKKLVRCNLTHLDLSLVTRDKNLRKKIWRREKMKGIFSTLSFLRKENIPVCIHFIVGLPEQSFKSALKDLFYLSRKEALLGISIFYPVIESELFLGLQRKYRISCYDYLYFRSSCAYFDKEMSKEEIFFLFYLSRIINFVKMVIREFRLEKDNFFIWLKKETEGVQLKDNFLITPYKKIDKIKLGTFLLRKFLEEKIIYRVVLEREKGDYKYRLEKEDFVSPSFIEGLLEKGIIIKEGESLIKLTFFRR